MTDNLSYLTNPNYTRKENRLLNYFWFGFIMYSSGYALMTTTTGTNVYAYAQLLALLIMVICASHLISFNLEDGYLKVIYYIYLAWIIIVIFRGFTFNKMFLGKMIFDAYGGILLYFVPLILVFPRKINFLAKVYNVIMICSFIYVIFLIIFIGDLLILGTDVDSQAKIEYFSKTLSIPCGFILFSYPYYKKSHVFWALFVILLTLFFATIRARRGLMFMCSSILVISLIKYFYINKGNLVNRYLPFILLPFIVILTINIYNVNKNSAFNLITERLEEDTRTGIELFFYADMETEDWIIGRGINGIYYCPVGIDDNVFSIPDYRGGVETDYLTIILKGGLISLGLLLLIAFPAIIKGLFYSKNSLSKAASLWILLWMIDLYPTTVTTFTLNYLLVWISISLCYSNELRNLSDDTIKEIFQYKAFKLLE